LRRQWNCFIHVSCSKWWWWSVALQPREGLGLPYGFHDNFIVRCGVISSTIDLF
jgi:hypothetical protein